MIIAALLAASIAYHATVLNVVDGDTLRVHVAGFPAAFDPIDIRVNGIDTPEHTMPPAQGACEVPMGQAAAVFAKTLVKPGDKVTVHYTKGQNDKYGRLLGTVTLPDGRDWGRAMITGHFARPYTAANLHKGPWC